MYEHPHVLNTHGIARAPPCVSVHTEPRSITTQTPLWTKENIPKCRTSTSPIPTQGLKEQTPESLKPLNPPSAAPPRTCHPQPQQCPSIAPTWLPDRKASRIPIPKAPGQSCRESSSNTLPSESVHETFPCAGCPICLVHLQAEILLLVDPERGGKKREEPSLQGTGRQREGIIGNRVEGGDKASPAPPSPGSAAAVASERAAAMGLGGSLASLCIVSPQCKLLQSHFMAETSGLIQREERGRGEKGSAHTR